MTSPVISVWRPSNVMRYRICTDYNITDKEGVEGAESPPFPNGVWT